jgi:hypothetical protein
MGNIDHINDQIQAALDQIIYYPQKVGVLKVPRMNDVSIFWCEEHEKQLFQKPTIFILEYEPTGKIVRGMFEYELKRVTDGR